MEPILVTGATGNVGAEVVRLLSERGVAVRAAVRPSGVAGYEPPPGATAVPFDFELPETYGEALRGVKKLFLMRPPALTDTKRLMNPAVDAARAAGVEQIVFLSLLGASRNRAVPHHAVEAHLRVAGVPWTFLRPSFFMQNLSTTHREEIRDLGEILVPAGQGTTSFIDVRDIAAVAAKTLTETGHTFQAYPLTGAEALDYGEVARILSDELGRPVVYRRPGLTRFVRHMRRRGMEWSFILVTAAIYTTARLGLAGLVTEDTARLLGRPPITLRQFARDHRACWAAGGARVR
jgi:uncharacterized protein YbjT (DUF2867 family)